MEIFISLYLTGCMVAGGIVIADDEAHGGKEKWYGILGATILSWIFVGFCLYHKN